MKPKLALVIMAAGNASRFGKPKQLESVGTSGECLMEYSLYHAVRLGFSQLLIITNNVLADQLFNKFSPIASMLNIGLNVIVQPLIIKEGNQLARTRPWGTGHALLTAARYIDSPFLLLNADDYYGLESIEAATAFLHGNTSDNQHALIAYPIKETLMPEKSFSRAVCETDEEGFLNCLHEYTALKMNAKGTVSVNSNGEIILIDPHELASINCWAFKPGIFKLVEPLFNAFVNAHASDASAEFFLPTAIETLIREKQVKVKVFKSNSSWFGLTYQEDLPVVRAKIQQLILQGEYPQPLWK